MKDVKDKNTKWPNEERRAAVDRGPVELMNLLEWEFRQRPIALRNYRKRYEDFCLWLYQRLPQVRRGR